MAIVRFKLNSKYPHMLTNRYLIFEDNRRIFLENNEVAEINLTCGRHTVYVKENNLRSNVIDFVITDDKEIIEFEVGYNVKGMKRLIDFWYVLFDREEYLYIKKRG